MMPTVHKHRPWKLMGVFLICFVVVAAVSHVLLGGPVITSVVMPPTMCAFTGLVTTLKLDADGASMMGRRLRWEHLELHETRAGVVLRARPEAVSHVGRFSVRLRTYEADWQNGRIGEDLERWAPGLVEGFIRSN